MVQVATEATAAQEVVTAKVATAQCHRKQNPGRASERMSFLGSIIDYQLYSKSNLYLRHYDESSECATARQHKVAEVACCRLERTLVGCTDPPRRGFSS